MIRLGRRAVIVIIIVASSNSWSQNGLSLPDAPSASASEGSHSALGSSREIDDFNLQPSPHRGLKGLFITFGEDQKRIWTSPARIRVSDTAWLVPLGGLSAGLFATDSSYSASLSKNPSTINHYNTLSNAGIAGLAGASAGMYLLSFPAHNEHWRETGFLSIRSFFRMPQFDHRS